MQINRAPVLTLWASIVAQRLGYDEEEALTLGKAFAGYTAQAKGRSLGIYKKKVKDESGETREVEFEINYVDLMGRSIPVIEEEKGIRAISKDRAISPDSVNKYISKKFGDALDEIKAAMVDLATSFEPGALNTQAFKLYESFRPDIPKGKRGWGAKGELDPEKIRSLVKG